MNITMYGLRLWLTALTMTTYLSACGGGGASPTTTTSTETSNTTPSASTAPSASSPGKSAIAAVTALKITGQPPQSISLGSTYYFNADVTGATKAVTFSITNKPYWATLNTLTGELRGTPDKSGNFSNITISATDGQSTATMKSFSIAVNSNGAVSKVSATVTWVAPTTNTDGSAINNLSGFVIHYGTNASALNQTVSIGSYVARSYNLTGLTAGVTYYFSVAAVNAMKVEGERSTVTSIKL